MHPQWIQNGAINVMTGSVHPALNSFIAGSQFPFSEKELNEGTNNGTAARQSCHLAPGQSGGGGKKALS
jgi:hypothetical protein